VGTYESVAALVAVGGATALVLREAVTYGRPPREREQPAEKPVQQPAPQPAPAPPPRPVETPVAPPVPAARPVTQPVVTQPVLTQPVATLPPHGDGSILATLAATEHDEQSALRRVGALVVLLGLTLFAALGLGLLIYSGVSALK
jgi:hypothetical protein